MEVSVKYKICMECYSKKAVWVGTKNFRTLCDDCVPKDCTCESEILKPCSCQWRKIYNENPEII